MQTELQGNDVCMRVFVSVCACLCVCRDRERDGCWCCLHRQGSCFFSAHKNTNGWKLFCEKFTKNTHLRGAFPARAHMLLSPSCPANDTLQLSIMCNMCTTLHCRSFCRKLVLIKENLCSWIKASFVLGLSARREFYLNQLQMKLSSRKACAGLRGRRNNLKSSFSKINKNYCVCSLSYYFRNMLSQF